MICPNCGKEFENGVCPSCGYNPMQQFQQGQQGQQPFVQQGQQPYVQQVIVQQPKKKHGCLIAIVVVIVILIIIGVAVSGGSDDDSKKTATVSGSDTSGTDFENQVLWESDGITVTLTGIDEDGLLGTELSMIVENTTDKNITVSSESVDVNGFTVTDSFYAEVSAGKKAAETLDIFDSELKDAGIENIETVEITLKAYDSDTFDDIAKSDTITINVS
jgi:hypothetical protein